MIIKFIMKVEMMNTLKFKQLN